MTTTPASLSSGSPTSGFYVDLGYRTAWDLVDDLPGAYTMALTLAISAP